MTEPDFCPEFFRRWFLSPAHSSRIIEVLRRWMTDLMPVTICREAAALSSIPESAGPVAARVDWDPALLVAQTEAVVQRAISRGKGGLSLWGSTGDDRSGRVGAMGWIRLDCGLEGSAEGALRLESDAMTLVLVDSVVDSERGGMQLADLCREVVCRGAMPLGVVAVDWPEGDGSGLTGADLSICEALEMDVMRSRSRRDDSETGVGEPRWLVVGLVREKEVLHSEGFGAEGEAILLLGDPVGADVEESGRGARLSSLELGAEKGMSDGLRMLMSGGRIRTAMGCGEGGLAGSVMRGVMGAGGMVGASLDLTELLAVVEREGGREGGRVLRWDGVWLGERPGRVLVTTLALDAGKVLAQARILGIPAVMLGWTGGESVRLRMPAGEVEWRLDRLKAFGP